MQHRTPHPTGDDDLSTADIAGPRDRGDEATDTASDTASEPPPIYPGESTGLPDAADRTDQGTQDEETGTDRTREAVAEPDRRPRDDTAETEGDTAENRLTRDDDTGTGRTRDDVDRTRGDTAGTDRASGDTAGAAQPRSDDAGTDRMDSADASDADGSSRLLSSEDEQDFRSRWHEIQSLFVDDPREAVHSADGLVADVMRTLAATFADHRQDLEGQWNKGEDVDTESLRMALRQYRTFFNRLLTR
ncbi:hypothetical protein [Streptomyces sp. SS]|uniref:hypothetical protein n=1 Tax=Streptomyces sp. SS TaxID=260742 RepID=UPI00030E8E17|nr:hypothetical protein [Streptomyces sp. SS]